MHLKRRKRSRQDSNYSTFHEYSKNSFGENGIFDVYKESSKLDETELNTIIELMQIQHDKVIIIDLTFALLNLVSNNYDS